MSRTLYVTVDPGRATEIKGMPKRRPIGQRPYSPQTQELLAGRMIFTTDTKAKPSYKTMAKHGLKLRSRAEDNGIYFWTE